MLQDYISEGSVSISTVVLAQNPSSERKITATSFQAEHTAHLEVFLSCKRIKLQGVLGAFAKHCIPAI